MTISDASGCTKTTTAVITQPGVLVLSVTTVNSTCGNANGSVDLTVSGGTSPYTYAWTGGATTQDISSKASGTYTVTVTDANACSKTISATISNTAGPSLTATQVNVLCNGASTGSVDLTVTGGTCHSPMPGPKEQRDHARSFEYCFRHLYCDCNGRQCLYKNNFSNPYPANSNCPD